MKPTTLVLAAALSVLSAVPLAAQQADARVPEVATPASAPATAEAGPRVRADVPAVPAFSESPAQPVRYRAPHTITITTVTLVLLVVILVLLIS